MAEARSAFTTRRGGCCAIRPVAGSDAVHENSLRFRGGLIVGEVRTDSPADRAGVQRGDILVGLHKFEMLNSDNVHYVLNQPELTGAQPLKFFVLRNSQLQDGKFQMGE